MEKKSLLTISELAEVTEIPESTVRRYLHTFSAFFDPKGGKRYKQYEAVASTNVLKTIKELYEKGYEKEYIHTVLSEKFTTILEVEEDEKTDLPSIATSEDVVKLLEGIEELKKGYQDLKNDREEDTAFKKALLEKVESQDKTIQKLAEWVQQLVEEKESERLLPSPVETAATTIEEIETVETMETVEKVVTDPPPKKGFFKRIFGK